MGVYAGAWRRYQRTTPDANPNLGAGVRREHLNPVEYADPFPEPTPVLPPGPEEWYAADDFMMPLEYAVRTPIAREPEDHSAGAVPRDLPPAAQQAASGRAHSVDRGSAAVQMFRPPLMREDAAVYQTQRLQKEYQTSFSRAALTRGKNSLPESNDGEIPPQGHYVTRWIDRQFKKRAARHDMMPLLAYRAQDAVSIPAPAPGQGNQYTSPYPNLANARGRKLMTPQVRRLPRPPDDTALIDGSEDPQYSTPVYWEL